MNDSPTKTPPASEQPANANVQQFAIEGMSCASCVGRVERAIAKVTGVRDVAVNLASGRAAVSFSGVPDIPGVVRAIEDTGYAAQADETELSIALATVVLFGPGLRFYRKGIPALLRGAPDMNSLVALGTGGGLGLLVVATFAPGLLPPARPTSTSRPPPSSSR
jgi:cation transport ATPase